MSPSRNSASPAFNLRSIAAARTAAGSQSLTGMVCLTTICSPPVVSPIQIVKQPSHFVIPATARLRRTRASRVDTLCLHLRNSGFARYARAPELTRVIGKRHRPYSWRRRVRRGPCPVCGAFFFPLRPSPREWSAERRTSLPSCRTLVPEGAGASRRSTAAISDPRVRVSWCPSRFLRVGRSASSPHRLVAPWSVRNHLERSQSSELLAEGS